YEISECLVGSEMCIRDSNLSVAGRYDQYRYSGNTIGKATWSGGLEWRPIDTLLVRGSYGTAFRAPDLHYVFAGPGNDETSAEDLYSCRADGATDCSDYERNLIRSRTGNRQLDPETSTSWSAGLVWSPAIGLDLSLDWFDIDMRKQVQDMDVRTILASEANCRLGSVDINSPTCVDALDRITRTSDGRLYGVRVAPINVARESTSGIDVGLRYRLQTGIGDFILNGTHTWVKKHDFQRYPGDPIQDQFAVNSNFDIPRTKTSLSVTWEKAAWSATVYGSRLGKLPSSDSYDQVFKWDSGDSPYIKATYRYNASLQYRFDDHSRLSLSVVNVFNKMPPKDATYTAYPYYDVSWFDSIGRTINLQYTHKFGGSAL
ncbi:TonB-dependent receptor domain-containing protein, partial [uncultured Stenotrophomonas sp.]|uniref:TonB-dependent receptor domain-containing protein n=1 Tax=uncultured Stenotrophomonas sp. TaxID=165438 RepID=UPI0025D6F1B4